MPAELSDPGVPVAQQKEKLRVVAETQLSCLASEFVAADEWNVFAEVKGDKSGQEIKNKILECLEKAQTAIQGPRFEDSHLELLKGRALLNEARRRRPIWYVANNQFGFLPILCTTASAGLTYWFVFVWYLHCPSLLVIRHPAFYGFLGAFLKSFYWLQFQINKGLLRPRWFAYFIVAPFVGLLLGSVSSLLVKVGFRLLDGSSARPLPDWRVVGLVAVFAGFNWEWALEKFRLSAEAVVARVAKK